MGNPPNTFLDAFRVNRKAAIEAALADDQVAIAIRELVEKNMGKWKGTSAELLLALNDQVGEKATKCQDWPKTPRGISGKLRRLTPLFRKVGLTADFAEEGHEKKKVWALEIVAKTQPAQPAQPAKQDKPNDTKDLRCGLFEKSNSPQQPAQPAQQPANPNGPPDNPDPTARKSPPTARTSDNSPQANPVNQASAGDAGCAGCSAVTISRAVGVSEENQSEPPLEMTSEPVPAWKAATRKFLGNPSNPDGKPPF